MTRRLTTNYAKNYSNRTLIVKVIVENVVTCFFGTRCSFWTKRNVNLFVNNNNNNNKFLNYDHLSEKKIGSINTT